MLRQFVPSVEHGKPNPSLVDQLSRLLFVASHGEQVKTCVISGAGVSTASGIPDYRSPKGSYSTGHKPMTHQQFVSSESNRKRYWARSVAASSYFKHAKPNDGHYALAELEKNGFVHGIVTQNVDRLHKRAGSQNVLELHGHVDDVSCLTCGKSYSRPGFHEEVRMANNDFFVAKIDPVQSKDIRADGDAHLSISDFREFIIPGCKSCGGVLMPTIVFFGGAVPAEARDRSFQMVKDSGSVLVVGSSLTVWSSFRLVKAAKEQGKPVAIVNIGPSRADDICDMKVESEIAPLLRSMVDVL